MGRAAACLGLCLGGWAAGCVPTENLGVRFAIVPDETRRIAIVHSRAFHEAGTLDDLPAGKCHWIEAPDDVARFLIEWTGTDNQDGEFGKSALTLLFFPADAFSRKQFDLDQHLDVMPGYVQHGEMVTSAGYQTTTEFKTHLIARLGHCPECCAYLGLGPPAAAGPAPGPPRS